MTRFFTLAEIIRLQQWIIQTTGGKSGVLDLRAIDSAVAQPQMTFGGADFYPTVIDKAAALGFSLIKNHGFDDGNKRIGYMAARMFLRMNKHDLTGTVDEKAAVIFALAASEIGREEFTEWVRAHTKALSFD